MVQSQRAIVFHIGLERTGTTSFQRFCTNHRALLQKSGILYPTRCLAFSAYSHGPLAGSYINPENGRDFTIRTAKASRQTVLRSLFDEAEKKAAHTILLSSEHLSSRLRTPEIEALAHDFSGFDCKILVIIRSHAQRFVSSYAISVMSGSSKTIEDYADEVLAEGSVHFCYRELLAPWERYFGRENLIIKPYQSGGGLFPVIFDSFAENRLSLPETESYTDNKSFGPSFTEAYRLTNLARSRARQNNGSISYVTWLKSRYCEVLLKQWLTQASKDQAPEPWYLSEKIMRRLENLAVPDRQWLETYYNVHLDGGQEGFGQPASRQLPNPAEILANALTIQIGARWNLFDAALPAIIPMKRVLNSWRISGQ